MANHNDTVNPETTNPEEGKAPEVINDPNEAARAEAEQILADAKAEAEKIVAEAKEKAAAGKANVGKGKKKEEMVSVRLFKDNGRYKDPVFVAVNGRRFMIERGKTVQVPRCVAQVLEQSANQDEATARLMDAESAAYEDQARTLNL